jgi:hypothetical protein
MEIKGLTGLRKRLESLEDKHARGYEVGSKLAGLALLRASQELVPVQTGNLRNSGRVQSSGSGFQTITEVGYFGVNYAVKVHEDLEARHAPGKQAKFLEQPAREMRQQLIDIIVKHTKAGQ